MASVHSEPKLSIRPSNKDPLWSRDCDELFDEHLDAIPFGALSDAEDTVPSDDLDQFCGTWTSSCDVGTIAASSSPQVHDSSFSYSTPQIPDFFDSPFGSPVISCKSQSVRQPSVPNTPAQATLRKTIRKSASQQSVSDRRTPSAGIRKTYRQASVSSSMAQPLVSRSPCQDLWTQRVASTAEKYNIPYMYQAGPLSPPPSVKMQQQWDDPSSFSLSHFDSSRTPQRSWNHNLNAQSLSAFQQHVATQYTPVSSPIEESNDNSTYFHQTSPSLHTPYLDHPFSPDLLEYQSPPSHDHELSSHDLASDGMHFAFNPSPRFQPQNTWWPPAVVSHDTSNYESSRRLSQTLLRSPFLSSSALVVDSSMDATGLGIACVPTQDAMKVYDSSSSHSQSRSSSLYDGAHYMPSTSTSTSTNLTITGASAGGAGLVIPVKKVRRQSSTHSPSVSPPLSSSVSSSRSAKRASKSSRRAKSISQTSGRGALTVGFVNFTPDDDEVILGGVAPSGSSKTKARREKEAAEKQRRLHEAAEKAVLDAGGDLTALKGFVNV